MLLCEPVGMLKLGRFLESAVWGIAEIGIALILGIAAAAAVTLAVGTQRRALHLTWILATVYFVGWCSFALVFDFRFAGGGCNSYP